MTDIAILILNTASYILILVLVALGLVVVFGMMGVINMAHGELFMLGAYTVVVTGQMGLPFWLGALLAPIFVGAVGLLIEWLLIRHVYRRTLDTILATWGLSIVLKQAVVLFYGPSSQSVTVPIAGAVAIGDFSYPIYRLVLMTMAVMLIAAMLWLFLRSEFGLRARAVMARPDTAACLGIDTRAMYRRTFVIGAALAGFAGAIVAPLISVDPAMGLGYLIPGFISIMVGGAGALSGVLLGGGLVGVTNNLLTVWLSPVLAQIAVFLLAIIIIRLRPSGLMGGRRGT